MPDFPFPLVTPFPFLFDILVYYMNMIPPVDPGPVVPPVDAPPFPLLWDIITAPIVP